MLELLSVDIEAAVPSRQVSPANQSTALETPLEMLQGVSPVVPLRDAVRVNI